MAEAYVKFDEDLSDEVKKELTKLHNKAVKVGVPGDANRQVIVRAGVHEYGSDSINIPETGYLRRAFDNNKREIFNMFKEGLDQILSRDKTAEEVMEEIGEFLKNEIQDNISKAGLVDTGQMRDSIDYSVVDA